MHVAVRVGEETQERAGKTMGGGACGAMAVARGGSVG